MTGNGYSRPNLWTLGIRAYARALDFRERSTRTEIVAFVVVVWVICFAIGIVALLVGVSPEQAFSMGSFPRGRFAVDILKTLLILPVMALFARRAHDFGWPGAVAAPLPILALALGIWRDLPHYGPGFVEMPWWLEIVRAVLVLGCFILVVAPPNPAANRYGPNPRPAPGPAA